MTKECIGTKGEQVADLRYADVGLESGGQRLAPVVALPDMDRGDLVAKLPSDGFQDARLVVDQDIALRRPALRDFGQMLFLVRVDQHLMIYRGGEAGPFDLAPLEYLIAVR